MQILIVEDEPKISSLIAKYLELAGLESTEAHSGDQAWSLFKARAFQLVILDIMLPGMSGLTLCEKIREKSSVPVIFLTARVQDVDKLLGFSKGADDYLCKPFNPQELVARVQAILRRVSAVKVTEPKRLHYEGIEILPEQFCVLIDQQEVALTQIEFNLLHTFVKSPNQVFTREELLTIAHGQYSDAYERTIDFHIKNLRKKINVAGNGKYIQSVYGVGYRLRKQSLS